MSSLLYTKLLSGRGETGADICYLPTNAIKKE
jgi:hypothetical protein